MTKKKKTVDWPKFYRALDKLKVKIPEPDVSDPALLHDVMSYLSKVNNNRMSLDHIQRKLQKRLGSIGNDIEVWNERLKIKRAEVRLDKQIMGRASNNADRDAIIDLETRVLSAQVTSLKAKKEEYKFALEAVQSTEATLKAAKETLNGIRQIVMTEMETINR